MTDLAAELLDHLRDGGRTRRVSVIGLSKNAGKTLTLGHIIRAAAAQSLTLGLVSTGRDGEEQDAVTELPKPRIWAPTGAWIATAGKALAASTARVTVFRELPMVTPFGPMLIGRVEAAGELLLIGPGTARRIGEVLGALEAYGSALSLVDGSFDRIAAAAPEVTDRVILAAGAAYSSNQEETLAQLGFVLEIFDLPAMVPALVPAGAAALRRPGVSMIGPGGEVTFLPVANALGDLRPILAAAREQTGGGPYLALSGALSDRLILALLQERVRLAGILVPDATHVLVERSLWRRWRRQGGEVLVGRPIRVLAVTTNPHSPVGTDYDAREFFESARELARRPVFDLEAGLTG